ncbi:hypothetical protein U0070_001219 [Myodes glareolus]|uniref:Uncharacterized protein n=1 Tax=Myodes glareolus TaxID=447135 RepID=A0AAW0H2P2_MYOGA
MLSDFLRAKKTISFIACATQYLLLAWMGMSECCLLAAMAYDRYVAIVSILKIASFKGCIKAFKTCGFHLATVTLFYGTVLSVYMHHSSQHSTKQDNVLSVVYAILIPMLNPLIYSLRNTEIKGVLKRMKKKVAHLPQKE